MVCFSLMGQHYFSPPYDSTTDCNDFTPVTVIYNEGLAVGFVFNHLAPLEGHRWEFITPEGFAVLFPPVELVPAPACLLQQVFAGGIRAMHVFFGERRSSCEGAVFPLIV